MGYFEIVVWTETIQTNQNLTEAHQRINVLGCHDDYVLYYAPGCQQGYPVPRTRGTSGDSGACGGDCGVYAMVEDTLRFVEVLLKSQAMWPDVLPAVIPSPGNLDGVPTGPVAKPDARLTRAPSWRSRAASEQRAKSAASLKDTRRTRAHSVRAAPAGARVPTVTVARVRGVPQGVHGVPGVCEVQRPAGVSSRRPEA